MLALNPLTLENPQWHWTRIVSQFETSSMLAAQLVPFEMVLTSHSYHYLWKPGCEIRQLENDSRRSAMYCKQPPEENQYDQENIFLTENLECLAVLRGKRGEDGGSETTLHPSRNQNTWKQYVTYCITALHTLYHAAQVLRVAHGLLNPSNELLMLKNDSSRSTSMQKLLSREASLTSMSLQLVNGQAVGDTAGAAYNNKAIDPSNNENRYSMTRNLNEYEAAHSTLPQVIQTNHVQSTQCQMHLMHQELCLATRRTNTACSYIVSKRH